VINILFIQISSVYAPAHFSEKKRQNHVLTKSGMTSATRFKLFSWVRSCQRLRDANKPSLSENLDPPLALRPALRNHWRHHSGACPPTHYYRYCCCCYCYIRNCPDP